MSDVLSKTTVLVLNRNWQAVGVKTPAEAFGMMAAGNATALEIRGDDFMSPVRCEDWLRLPVRADDNSIGPVHGPVRVRTVAAPEELRGGADALDVLDSGALDPALVTPGRDNEACGRASAVWLDEADAFARAGRLQATVMAPISSVAMDMVVCADRYRSWR